MIQIVTQWIFKIGANIRTGTGVNNFESLKVKSGEIKHNGALQAQITIPVCKGDHLI